MWALVLTSQFGALLPIDRHALPVPVNSDTHLVPERNLVPPLHDTGTECDQISYRYEPFELDNTRFPAFPGLETEIEEDRLRS